MDSGQSQLERTILASIPPSQAWRDLAELIVAAVRTDVPLLITGEQGVGKSWLVALIHKLQRQHGGPFICLPLVARSAEVISDELFGHVKGAFTSAHADRAGAVRLARAGTLYLDEIGELPPELQPLLLRLLEEKRYRPVGSDVEHIADNRFVMSTNCDLVRRTSEGMFREDLYYRVHGGIHIPVPPLRSQPESISALVRAAAAEQGATITAAGLAAFACRSYPGNIRELRSAVLRVAALANGRPIGQALVERFAPVECPSSVTPSSSPARPWVPATAAIPIDPDALADAFLQAHDFRMSSMRDRLINRCVVSTQGNKSEAARRLELGYGAVRQAFGRLRSA